MKILITGASGYIGSSIYSKLKEKHNVIGTYNSYKIFPELEKLDITDRNNVIFFIKKYKPSLIIHTAAKVSSNWCEKNKDLAILVNQVATKYIVDAANEVNSKIIFISSFAAYNQDSVYGKTKAAGEQYVQSTKAGYIILRPSLVIGLSPNKINENFFNLILKNIIDSTTAVYDNSWFFQPTWLEHINQIIDCVIEKRIVNETIPVCVPELKSKYQIATDILSKFEIPVFEFFDKDQKPIFGEDSSKLEELNLPKYSYDEILKNVIKEIKEYLKEKTH